MSQIPTTHRLHRFTPRMKQLALLLTITWGVSTSAAASTTAEGVFAPPTPAELKQAVGEWMVAHGHAETPLRDAVAPSWEFADTPTAEQLFDALLQTFYLADEDVRSLVDACRDLRYRPGLLQLKAPSTERTAAEPLLGHNVRYFLARHLSLLTAYNEAVDLFQQIDPQYLVDPAGYFFHRAVCEHHLLYRDSGLETLDALLNRTEEIPFRYRKLGELMQQDLQSVKEKSLGEVARQMRDVERQLQLQRTDENVQDVENRIIATLDELIKQLEDQQQQSQSASAGGSGSSAPQQGASDTYLGGIKGEGLTDKKDIGNKDNWGDLPPKAREAAKNMLDRQFPAHYRQAVEEYLKKLADRPAPK